LTVTVIEKIGEGGWVTLVITACLVGVCFLVKRHYGFVVRAIRALDKEIPAPEEIQGAELEPSGTAALAGEGEPRSEQPIAILFVGGYGGLGRHALFSL